MVSFFERSISLFGLFSLYSYTFYKFIKMRSSFDKRFHESVLIQSNKFVAEQNNSNLKVVTTPE